MRSGRFGLVAPTADEAVVGTFGELNRLDDKDVFITF